MLLGKGSFACVYRAKSVKTGLEVAIKTVRFIPSLLWLAACVILPCGDSCWVNCWVIGSLLPPRGVLWSFIPHIASDRLIIVTGFNLLQTPSTG